MFFNFPKKEYPIPTIEKRDGEYYLMAIQVGLIKYVFGTRGLRIIRKQWKNRFRFDYKDFTLIWLQKTPMTEPLVEYSGN